MWSSTFFLLPYCSSKGKNMHCFFENNVFRSEKKISMDFFSNNQSPIQWESILQRQYSNPPRRTGYFGVQILRAHPVLSQHDFLVYEFSKEFSRLSIGYWVLRIISKNRLTNLTNTFFFTELHAALWWLTQHFSFEYTNSIWHICWSSSVKSRKESA